MKYVKILSAAILICFFGACTSDSESNTNQDTKSESKNIEEIQPDVNFRLLANKTEKELNLLLDSEGYDNLYDSKLVIGTLDNNELKIYPNKTKEILSLYFKLTSQEIGYDVDYNSFEFLSAKENNGHSMLISKGVCKVKGKGVSIGIPIVVSLNREALLDNTLSTVTCTGCDVGCSPRRDKNGDGWCTNCVSYGNCTKTETIGN